MSKAHCPKCGSQNCVAVKSKSVNLLLESNQGCVACGAVWKPAIPKYRAIAAIVIGGLFLLFVIGVVIEKVFFPPKPAVIYSSQNADDVEAQKTAAFIFGLAGSGLIGFGIRALKGKSGKLEILNEGKSSNSTDA
jgi:hypothetical protein